MVQPITYIDVTVGTDPGTASSGATTAGTLSAAIAQLNASDLAGGPYVIRLDTDVSLSGPLSPILGSVTIEGNGHTIDAGGATRIFFVGTDRASQSEFQSSILSQRQKVTIADVTLTGGTAQGGAGGSGGGGGLGAGGALFVNQSADVTLSNVTFSGDSAVGGAGTTTLGQHGGGGGGLGGAGGSSGGGGGLFGAAGPGNGGGGLFGAAGGSGGGGFSGDSSSASGANGTLPIYGLNGGGGSVSTITGGSVGGAGGTSANGDGGGGGFGGGKGDLYGDAGRGGFGGGGGSSQDGYGGRGGFGGGGGHSYFGPGGYGGFGGGGGGGGSGGSQDGGGAGGFGGGGGSGSGSGSRRVGGAGGFGGGGGSSDGTAGTLGGASGFGASASSSSQGGGGGGLGGAVFVASGGTLTIDGSGALAGTATGGTGGDGTTAPAFGGGIFYQGNADGSASTLTIGAGIETISSAIGDYLGSGGTNPTNGANAADQGGSLAIDKTGSGTLTLSAANTYTGGTTVEFGELAVAHSDPNGFIDALGSGIVTLKRGGVLQDSAGNTTLKNDIVIDDGGGTISAFGAGFFVVDGSIGGSATLLLADNGGGIFLGGDNSNFTGATIIETNTIVIAQGTLALSSGSAYQVDNGAYLFLSYSTTIGSLADWVDGGGIVDGNGAQTLTTGGDGTSTTFSGTIEDGGTPLALLKTGVGTFTLAGTNTYTGGTSNDAGTLSLAHATSGTVDAAGTGAIAINGAVLELAVMGTLANELDLGAGGTDVVGAAAGQTATLTGPLVVAAGTGTLAFGSATDTGTVVLGSSSVTLNGIPGTLEIAGGTLQAASRNNSVNVLTRNAGTATQIDDGATLDLGDNTTIVAALTGTGTLTNSNTTSIRGGTFGGTIAGSGDVIFAGSTGLSGVSTNSGTSRIGSGVTLTLLNRSASLGATSQVIDLGTLNLRGDVFDTASLSGTGKVTGYGTIDSTVGGTLTYEIDSRQTLQFRGTGNRFAGAIGGTGGVVYFDSGSSDLFQKGTTFGVDLFIAGAAVTIGANLSSTHGLSLFGGSLAFGGNTLTVFGYTDFFNGSIAAGSGGVTLRGQTTIDGDVSSGARISNAARLTQTRAATLTFTGPGTLVNAAGATYDIQGDGGITAGVRMLSNSGTLEKTAGYSSTIAGGLVNSAGAVLKAASGTIAVTGTVLNSGTVEAMWGGTIDLMGMVGGRGTLDVEANSIVELGAMIGAAQTAKFGSDGGTLRLDASAQMRGTIDGFGGNDAIDLQGYDSATRLVYHEAAGGNGGTLSLVDGAAHTNLAFAGAYSAASFSLTATSGGEALHYTPPSTAA